MNFIKFIRIFLLVLIIVGIGLLATQKMWVPKIVGAILVNQNQEQLISKIPILDSKVDTSSWKTYINTQYGFELRYPYGWILSSTSSGSLSISRTTKIKDNLISEGSFRVVSPRDLSSTPSLKDQLLTYINQKSNFTIGGGQSIREVRKDDDKVYMEYVSFIRGNQYFVVTLTWTGDQSMDSSLKKDDTKNKVDTLKIFDQILFTFKFTK